MGTPLAGSDLSKEAECLLTPCPFDSSITALAAIGQALDPGGPAVRLRDALQGFSQCCCLCLQGVAARRVRLDLPVPAHSQSEWERKLRYDLGGRNQLFALPPWLPLKYKAQVVIHGPKGCGEPCEPLAEYLTQQLLVFDVGQVAWNLPQRFVVFGGYRWWKNKFGISPDQPNGFFVGTNESTWLAGTTMKF
jgi:hypothetical protein